MNLNGDPAFHLPFDTLVARLGALLAPRDTGTLGRGLDRRSYRA
jgi:hypothetical protein